MKTRSAHSLLKGLICLTAVLLALCLGAAWAEGARTLKMGMRGDDVLSAQRRLTELGYYDGKASGTFDSATRAAAKLFQAGNGLRQTGSLTGEEQQLLFGELAVTRSQYDEFCPLSSDSKGEAVKRLQERLSALGYYDGKVDGRYASAVKSAVRAFQTANGLRATGKADTNTRRLMNGETAVSFAEYQTFCALSSGSSGEAVRLLQTRLRALGYYTGEADGKYGAAVKAAVKRFQTAHGLKATGKADAATRKRMNAQDALPASEYDKVCPLKYGEKNEAVKLLKTRLAELGYFAGTMTESYDKATRTAVSEFQSANSLKATGSADYATRALMNGEQAKDSSAYYQTLALRPGTSSAAVRVLKARLTALGYFAGTIDCTYDKALKSAVSLFQQANALRATGTADASTRRVMNGAQAVTRAEYDLIRPVSVGDRGDAASQVQRQLKDLGYYTGEVTGRFDRTTSQAASDFQMANSLSKTGKADAPTRKLLNAGNGVTRAQYDTFCPLKSGNKGEAVKLLQTRLIQLGFYAWDVTGSYDANTKTAVKAYQTAASLRVTGTADTDTRKKMNAPDAVTRAAYDARRVISKGEKTTTVRLLKTRLKVLGYYTGEVNITFDNALVTSVKLFQTAHSLPVTGKADVETRLQIFSSDAVSYDLYLTYCPIKYGEKGAAVRAVQRQLLNLGYYSGALDGSFGETLLRAARLFAQANDLTVEKNITADMRKLLNAGGGISLSEYYRTCAVKKGDKGEAVRQVQVRLNALGYYTGKLDGSYGAELETAVRLFQKAHALTESGAANKTTRAAMNDKNALTLKEYQDKVQRELEEREAVTRAEKIEKLIAVAESKLGCRYVLNSGGPDTFDCSNYTKYCYGKVGVKISGRVIVQGYMTGYPKITDPKKLERGDLLIFDTVKTDDDLSDHAGIYLGNDQFIHCSSVRGQVVISRFSTYGNFSWGFRLL